MSKEKEGKAKTGKTAAIHTLKEKRATKQAKRDERKMGEQLVLIDKNQKKNAGK